MSATSSSDAKVEEKTREIGIQADKSDSERQDKHMSIEINRSRVDSGHKRSMVVGSSESGEYIAKQKIKLPVLRNATQSFVASRASKDSDFDSSKGDKPKKRVKRSRDYDVKSKVSFSDNIDLIDVQNIMSDKKQRSSLEINKTAVDNVSKHSLVPSMTNSEFFQSSPEPMKHHKLMKEGDDGDEKAQSDDKNYVDMGTDPMSRHQVSEKMNIGSERKTKANLSAHDDKQSEKSVQASQKSEYLLPTKKIKRKPEEVDTGEQVDKDAAKVQEKGNQQVDKPAKRKKSPYEAAQKGTKKKRVVKSTSPIIEVDENNGSRKKLRKRSKDTSSLEDIRKGKVRSPKAEKKLVARRAEQNRTTGFESSPSGKRKVDFSDIDELIEAKETTKTFAATK